MVSARLTFSRDSTSTAKQNKEQDDHHDHTDDHPHRALVVPLHCDLYTMVGVCNPQTARSICILCTIWKQINTRVHHIAIFEEVSKLHAILVLLR